MSLSTLAEAGIAPAPDLRHRAVEGAFWNISFALMNKGVTLAGQLALAWLLMPADIGLANMAQAMAVLAAFLSVEGLGDILLQRGAYDREAGQALWLALACTTLMSLVIVGLAFFSPLFGKPGLRPLLALLALATLIAFPAAILSAGLKKKLDFKGLAIAHFWGGLAYTSTAVLLAKGGWVAEALIAAIIPQQLAIMGSILRRGVRPPFKFPQQALMKALLRPTFALSSSGFFLALQVQGPIFACGLALSSDGVGIFSWGWAVAGQAVFLLATNLREVLLPVFIRLKDDPAHRAVKALKAARVITALLCVACGTQALLAAPLIRLFLPEKWSPAVPVVILASLGLTLQGLGIAGMAWMTACGRYRALFKLSALQAALAIGLTWAGAQWAGPTGAAAGFAMATLLGSLASVLPMGWRWLLAESGTWWRPLASSLAIWSLCALASRGQGTAVQLIAAAIYLGLSAWLWWLDADSDLGSLLIGLSAALSGRRARAPTAP